MHVSVLQILVHLVLLILGGIANTGLLAQYPSTLFVFGEKVSINCDNSTPYSTPITCATNYKSGDSLLPWGCMQTSRTS